MLLIIKLKENRKLYRTVTRNNIRKIAKSIKTHFPARDYPILEAIIFNGIAKDLKELTLVGKND